MKNFSLVLSGGGALGIAHLGVLDDLEEYKLFPSEIIGTSMGGIIGAGIAIGMKEKDIFEIIKEFSNVFNWIKFSFSSNAIIKTDKIEKIFDLIFGNKKIKDTTIPLKIIATNLRTTECKVFTKDDDILIKDALLATMAIPGVFEEKEINNEIYVDGFLTQNLGVKEASLDNIIAVDVLGKNSFSTSLPQNSIKTKNVLDMFEKSLRILIYNQTKQSINNLDKNKRLILLEPDTKKYKTYHFHKYKEIKECGKGLLMQNLP
ncbi:patatin-like phospholipase family protein [Caminibacter pacificus]|jgi:NTE family protein